MKERPILFSAPMVRAILAGSKTQTRLVIKPRPELDGRNGASYAMSRRQGWVGRTAGLKKVLPRLCQHGQPGDRLWVRESWHACRSFDGTSPREIGPDSESAAEMRVPKAARRCRRVAPHPTEPSINLPRFGSKATVPAHGT